MHRLHALTTGTYIINIISEISTETIYMSLGRMILSHLGDAHTAKNHLQASKWTRTVTNTSCCPTWQLEGSSPRLTYICMYYIIT